MDYKFLHSSRSQNGKLRTLRVHSEIDAEGVSIYEIELLHGKRSRSVRRLFSGRSLWKLEEDAIDLLNLDIQSLRARKYDDYYMQ